MKLPDNHGDLSKAEIVKMLYLVSGWIYEKGFPLTAEILDQIAIETHDSED